MRSSGADVVPALRQLKKKAAMGIAGQIDQILMSRSAKSARRCVYCCIVLVFLVDLAGVIVLRAAPQFVPDDLGRTEELKWTPRGLWEALKKFHYDSVDLVLLCLARLVIFNLLAYLGVKVGKPKLDDLVGQPTFPGEGTSAPLLVNAGAAGAPLTCAVCPACTAPSGRGPGLGLTTTAGGRTITTEVKEEHLTSHKRKQAAEMKANAVCALMFIFGTSSQVYVGVKAISFNHGWEYSPMLQVLVLP